MLPTRLEPAELRPAVRRLLAGRAPKHSLPQPFYNDASIHALDVELLLGQWVFGALECEVAEPGAFRTVEIGASSILIVRGRDGELRAFHNSCRHRGSQLCDSDRGRSPTLLCPYHHWAYDLTGRLVRAPNMPADFDKAAHALVPVHVAVVEGVIFICAAAEPPDIEAFRAAAAPRFAPHRLRDAKVVQEITLVEQANWKLVWENARECDHCNAGHPELMRTLRMFNFSDPESDAEIARFWDRCEATGLPSRTVDGHGFRLGRIPLNPGQLSITEDGQPAVARRLGDWPEADIGSLRWTLWPSVFSHIHADYAVFVRILPTGPRETQLVCKWVVHKDAEAGRDYDPARLEHIWRVTNEQDRRFCERNQRGVDSVGYRPGPYADPSESGVWTFVNWYCGELERMLAQPGKG